MVKNLISYVHFKAKLDCDNSVNYSRMPKENNCSHSKCLLAKKKISNIIFVLHWVLRTSNVLPPINCKCGRYLKLKQWWNVLSYATLCWVRMIKKIVLSHIRYTAPLVIR